MPQMTDTIEAKLRDGRGKGAAHKLRKSGQVPAIVYGPGAEPRFLSVDPKTFALQKAQFGISHIFDVTVDGTKFKALIREVQVNPVTQEMLHVDLYALDMTKPLKIEVPLELEGKPAGLLDGGILSQIVRRILVECLPNAIPEKVTVDVSALTIGQSVKASDVKVPSGAKIVGRLDQAVATVVAPAEEEVAPVAAEAAAVEGAEGAPAAEGAAPAEGAAAGAPAAAGEKAAGEKAGGDKAAAPAGAAPAKGGKEGKGKK